jgi:hypothetical protein
VPAIHRNWAEIKLLFERTIARGQDLGKGRTGLTLLRVLITVMGIEKVLPGWRGYAPLWARRPPSPRPGAPIVKQAHWEPAAIRSRSTSSARRRGLSGDSEASARRRAARRW